jgi:hypothetical protein
VRLTRDRAADAAMIGDLLAEGDLAICPAGSPSCCASPRSPDEHVPRHHGKGTDPFYFFMNPSPAYVVRLPPELTCAGGKTSHEVANYIQRLLAATLPCQCTSLTRKEQVPGASWQRKGNSTTQQTTVV